MTAENSPGQEALREAALELAWSLWAECGLSTWGPRNHRDWAIELEPLLVLTALLSRHDPRLMREAVDWCVHHERFVSLNQFRHVVTAERWPFKGGIGVFAATVSYHSGRRWPGATTEDPVPTSLGRKSQAPDLRRPSLLQLRLRALFGVSARPEIIRGLLMQPAAWSVRQVADRVAYTRRQVAWDLEMLAAGGLVHKSPWTSPATYVLSDPEALARVVGPLPTYAVVWAPVLRLLTGLLEAFDGLTVLAAPDVELRRRIRQLEPSLGRAGFRLPSPPGDHDGVEAMMRWSVETFRALAAGTPPSTLRVEEHRNAPARDPAFPS